MHARMREKLAEKQMQEQAEADEKAARVQLREQYKPSVDAWCHQKKVRSLLWWCNVVGQWRPWEMTTHTLAGSKFA